MNRIHAVLFAALLAAAPAGASTLQVFESSNGAPGITALFPYGSGQIANLDYDASSAEGGSLPFGGASEITFIPTGDLVFSAFTCEFAGCSEGFDYTFTAGGAGLGELVVSDTNFGAQSGILDIGLLTFDIAANFGTIELTGCNYTDANAVERTCDPFTVVSVPVPEPGTALLLGLGMGAVAVCRRRLA